MKYLHTDPSSPAGPLIPKRRAPVCMKCGRVLWQQMYHVPYPRYPTHNVHGTSPGCVPNHHGDTKATAHCFNRKACAKRIKPQAVATTLKEAARQHVAMAAEKHPHQPAIFLTIAHDSFMAGGKWKPKSK